MNNPLSAGTVGLIIVVSFFSMHPAIAGPENKFSQIKIDLHPELTAAHQAVDKDLRDSVTILEKKFIDSGTVYDDPALSAYVNGLLTAEDLGVPENEFKFKARILKLPDENAFAFPSGNIYINAGIIPLTKHPDELRFILAHESMHVIGKHIVFHNKGNREHITAVKILDILIVPAASIVNIYTDFQYTDLISGIADLTGTAAGLFYVASVQGYGRGMEIESDHFACMVLDRMGKDMSAAASFFRSFKQMHEKYIGMEMTHFASSHESSGDRLKRVKGFMPAGQEPAELAPDMDYIRTTLNVRLDVAELNIKLGRIHRAMDSLNALAELQISDARTQYLLGEACRRLAEEPQLSKRELVRKEWLALAKSGDPKLSEQWKKRSLEHYQAALKLDTAYAPAHRGLALYYEAAGEYTQANSHYGSYLQFAQSPSDQRFIKAKIKLMAERQAEKALVTIRTNEKGAKG